MKPTPRSRLNALSYAVMLREFLTGPATATEIADTTGFARKTMVATLRTMHDYGVLHIVEWEMVGNRNRVPVYALGIGKDVRRPDKMPKSEINRRHKAVIAQRAVLGMAA